MLDRLVLAVVLLALTPAVSAAQQGTAVDYCVLRFPLSTAVAEGNTTEAIYGQIFEDGVTEAAGAASSVTAQLGYRPAGTDPRTNADWTYRTASFDRQVDNADEYQAVLTAPSAAETITYAYAYCFSLDGGAS